MILFTLPKVYLVYPHAAESYVKRKMIRICFALFYFRLYYSKYFRKGQPSPIKNLNAAKREKRNVSLFKKRSLFLF